MKVRAFVSMGALACLAVSLAWSQPPQQGQSADQTFISKSLEGNMLTLKLLHLAQERTTNPDVKQFAQKLAEAHAGLGNGLKELASKSQIQVPSDLNKEDQQVWQRLSNLRGAEFDREFVQYIIQDHRREFTMYENESKNGQNPMIKAFAVKILPAFKEHLKMAEDLSAKLR
jgi:putative membrane protein